MFSETTLDNSCGCIAVCNPDKIWRLDIEALEAEVKAFASSLIIVERVADKPFIGATYPSLAMTTPTKRMPRTSRGKGKEQRVY
jgi:hypothetical protein